MATLVTEARCPCCGFRSRGVQVGTARPRMRGLTVLPGSFGWAPSACVECGHPLAPPLYDRAVADEETTASWRAWRDRQRARRKRAAR